VDRPGDELLSGPAPALDQDGRLEACDVLHQLEDLQHLRALADEVVELVLFFELLPEDGVLALEILHLDDPGGQE
jgi:hypothetical protein